MKKKKIFLIVPFFFAVILLITACDKKNEINSPQTENFESSQYILIDNTDLENGVEAATLEKPMDFSGNLFDYNFMNMGSGFNMGNGPMHGEAWFDKFDFNKHLGRIFRQLNLSDEQKTSVHGFMTDYHVAVRPLVREFRDANKVIVDSANAQRRVILNDLRNGLINREEAKLKLQTLNEETKNNIENNPATVSVKQKLCTERQKLFDKIASVLNADQLLKWNEFIAKLKNPCL